MDAPFPFGLPPATALYLVLYVFTLIIHVAFMNYVLAGTGWLAINYLGPWRNAGGTSTHILKDWMPLMLSGAITAGVAPLLFLQILYKQEFYTANLLLFNRWMAIVPVLIAGFYALYLLKAKWFMSSAAWIIALVAFIPFLCVAFTGYSWTENHLLSVRDQKFWGEFYATRSQIYSEPQLWPRLLVWAFGSISTMAAILAWQMWYAGDTNTKSTSRPALAGLAVTGIVSVWYYYAAPDATRDAFLSPMAFPYFVLAGLGLLIQVFGWIWNLRGDSPSVMKLGVITFGLSATLTGMTVCREAVRIHTLGASRFIASYPAHELALQKSGFVVFLFFFVLNAGLIAWCFWLVRNRMVPKPTSPGEPTA